LPLGWAWTRLGNLIHLVSGQHLQPPEYTEDATKGLPYITGPSDFGHDGLLISRFALVKKAVAKKGQLLLTVKGSGVGKTTTCNIAEVAISRQLMALTAICWDSQFLVLITHRLAEELQEQARSLIPGISREDVEEFIFALPPLAEQHRIVAKVDELMALCGRLEAARQAREVTRDRFAASSLARLNAPNPETFHADARFALDALPALTSRPDQIKHLRQTILNLAVRGKLLPQNANDESASELLKRIAEERAELIRRQLIRREHPLAAIQPSDLPFDIANKWIWSRIGDAVLFTQYGTSQRASPSEKGIPVLTMGNIRDGLVVWDNNEKKIPETSEGLPDLHLSKFDILYNRTNSAELVGKTGIYLGEDGIRTFASYLIRLRPSLKWTEPRYINIAMNAPVFRETQIVPLIKKQTGQANVNGTALKNMLIPLPPLAEQHRIVAKVDELMAICNRLETNLTSANDARHSLLDSLLAEALSPSETRVRLAAE
jgi:type I restriction enzyme S subunit